MCAAPYFSGPGYATIGGRVTNKGRERGATVRVIILVGSGIVAAVGLAAGIWLGVTQGQPAQVDYRGLDVGAVSRAS